MPRAGPNGGNENHYRVAQNPPPANGANAEYFVFTTPTYPNGNNGQYLNDERDSVDAHSLSNPTDCEDPRITSTGTRGINYQDVDTEHAIDRSVIPTYFLEEFAQTGQIYPEDASDTVHQTSLPTWDWSDLYQYFAHEYRDWVAHTPAQDIVPGSGA